MVLQNPPFSAMIFSANLHLQWFFLIRFAYFPIFSDEFSLFSMLFQVIFLKISHVLPYSGGYIGGSSGDSGGYIVPMFFHIFPCSSHSNSHIVPGFPWLARHWCPGSARGCAPVHTAIHSRASWVARCSGI